MAGPTGQQIINAALTQLGIMDPGGNPSVSDSNMALERLNAWWDAAQIDDGLIYSVLPITLPMLAATANYKMGQSQAAPFNVRPTRIFGAAMVLSVGGGFARRPLKVVNQETFFGHGDLSATAQFSDEVYYDGNTDPANGFGTLSLWPLPACLVTTTTELQAGAIFTVWTLAGTFYLPYGYQDSLEKILAWQVLPAFGAAVDAKTAQVIETQAQAAEQKIRKMNAANRQVPPNALGVTPMPGQQPGTGAAAGATPAPTEQ